MEYSERTCGRLRWLGWLVRRHLCTPSDNPSAEDSFQIKFWWYEFWPSFLEPLIIFTFIIIVITITITITINIIILIKINMLSFTPMIMINVLPHLSFIPHLSHGLSSVCPHRCVLQTKHLKHTLCDAFWKQRKVCLNHTMNLTLPGTWHLAWCLFYMTHYNKGVWALPLWMWSIDVSWSLRPALQIYSLLHALYTLCSFYSNMFQTGLACQHCSLL